MKIEEYKGISKLTGVFPQKVEDFGKVYAILGILDEMQELEDASPEDLPKEAGDVCWYIDCACEQFGLNIQDIFKVDMSHYDERTYQFFGSLKKYYRDGKPLDKEIVVAYLKAVVLDLTAILDYAGLKLEDILQINYDKLMDRKKRGVIQGDGDNR